MEDVLTADQLSFGFSDSYYIKELSLRFKKREVVSIIGPNGSGKSTVLRLLTRLLKPAHGAVYLEGKPLHTLSSKNIAKKLTMLPQIYDHRSEMTVRDLVKFGRQPHLKWYEDYHQSHDTYIDWALEATRLTALQHRPLSSLSGGERQRAWIAMALAQKTPILFLDEPTTFLDMYFQFEILELVKSLNERYGLTIVMVLHDVNQAIRYSDRLIVMKAGEIILEGTPEEMLTAEMFKAVYGVDVLIKEDEEMGLFVVPKGI
ncbi:ABC transporter ATP-binding protein [Alkalihalobacillus oceani]|uniref:ABC transporter ATP-binding protein n=1 Tax=Halalkalibacter oceani TaxID=1653776 RepID=UPI00203BBC27|nr:ABC transporter ATP-binding protein [Halalkalibacter oceani]MCM3760466.1 ABC transporter ATP-binding protein [Halalkalibacter oceani]